MERKLSLALFLTPALACSLLLSWDSRAASSHPQEASPPKSYAQVTSVTIEPSTIHKAQSPNTATVIVQILLRGEAPPNPKAVVEVGTASSDPPNNVLRYENPTRTVSLQDGVTVVRFKAETIPKTFRGKMKVIATLGGASNGIEIKDSDPKDNIVELDVLNP